MSSLAPVPLDTIARQTDAALPEGRTVSFRLPASPGGVVVARKRLAGDLDLRGGSLVLADRYTGRILDVHDARRGPPARRLWQLVAPLHFGNFGGLASKIPYFVGGLTSSVLVVTGFLIWLTRPRVRAGA